MSTLPTERQIESKLSDAVESLEETHTTGEITVLWGTTDPEHRPDGMRWVAETDTLTYDLWDAQRDALETLKSGIDITGFLAGYGSGKTIFGARWLIKQACDHPGSRFLGMGIDFQKARDATFRVLFEQLPGDRTGLVTSSYNGPEQSPIVADYNRQNHRLTLINDTVIKLGSADRWNRYAGDSFGGVWLDEPSHYGEDLHDLLEMIGSRLRGVAGPQAQLWTLTGAGKGPAFDVLERKVDMNDEPLGLEIEIVRASTLDNPYLSTGEKERFKRQYGDTSREGQALHGGFSDAKGSFLSRDQLQFVHPDSLEGEVQYHLGVDLAYADAQAAAKNDTDYSAVAFVGYFPGEHRAALIDISRQRGATFRETIGWISDIAREVPGARVKVEDVGAQVWASQELNQTITNPVQQINPGNRSKESRISDLGVVAERGDLLLVNHDPDDALGYDPRWKPLVREWIEFGGTDNSPDILDSVWYALQGLSLGAASGRGALYTADPFGNAGK